jgi:hypothetical protein
MKTSVKIALFVVFFLAVGGILAALYLYNLKAKDLHKVNPDFVISSSEFQKAFEADEKASSAKYINKIIDVSGEIGSVKRGEKNTMNVSLKTGSDLSSIICTFPIVPDTTSLKIGNQIIIRGECSGFLMDVLLNNCVVVR